MRMSDSTWQDHWEQYRDHVATAGQQGAALDDHVNNWLVHQQGLYALGKFPIDVSLLTLTHIDVKLISSQATLTVHTSKTALTASNTVLASKQC